MSDAMAFIEDALEKAREPLYRSLEVGFRHSPLTDKEMLQRYSETCEDIVDLLEHGLKAMQQG